MLHRKWSAFWPHTSMLQPEKHFCFFFSNNPHLQVHLFLLLLFSLVLWTQSSSYLNHPCVVWNKTKNVKRLTMKKNKKPSHLLHRAVPTYHPFSEHPQQQRQRSKHGPLSLNCGKKWRRTSPWQCLELATVLSARSEHLSKQRHAKSMMKCLKYSFLFCSYIGNSFIII